MIAEGRALNKVLEKVRVDVLGHVGPDAARDVVGDGGGRVVGLVAQGAARGIGRRRLRDGRRVGAGGRGAGAGAGGRGGGSLGRPPHGRRSILPDDDALAGSPDRSSLFFVLFLVA